MANTKYTFYICSDIINNKNRNVIHNINNKSEDNKRINEFVKAFKKAGHNAKNCGVGSNIHSFPNKYGCSGSDKKVWVFIVGGDCAGTYRDMTAKYFKAKLNGAKLCFIRQYRELGAKRGIKKKASAIKTLGRSYDDTFSKTDPTITGGLDKFFQKNGVSYFEGSRKKIIEQIEKGEIQGAGLSGYGKGSTTSSTKQSVKYGYSTSSPFTAYLEIQYTKDKNWNHKDKPKIKKLTVDFSMKAPKATTTNKISYTTYSTKKTKDGKTKKEKIRKTVTIPPSFTNNLPSWVNKMIRENSFNLLEFIQEAEKDYNKEHKYYLYRVSFKAEFPENKTEATSTDDSGESTKTVTNYLYEDSDEASYKMNLYSIGLYKGDTVNAKNYQSSGKSVNNIIKSVLNETDYHAKMKYGKFRNQDSIMFNKIVEGETKPVFDFYEMEHWNDANNKRYLVDGTIIGLSNVQYQPINDTLNNSLFIFKGRYDVMRDAETLKYFYQRYCNLDKILKYGEQTLMNSDTNNELSYTEAYNLARANYINNYEERRSYTITVAGIPPVSINDFVRTTMDNPLLDSGSRGLKVSSIEYKMNPDTRPVIQTTLGLGKPDKKFEMEKMRKIQRERLTQKELNIPVSVVYNGDDNIEGLL